MRAPSLLLTLAVLFSGCYLENASTTKRMTDAVHEMNDSARWGRIGSAARFVEPTYRQQFVLTHAAWGKAIRVADGEVLSLRFAPDKESAEAIVTYSWYDLQTMTLHDTVVRQRWISQEDFFGLRDETVIEGNPRLFAQK